MGADLHNLGSTENQQREDTPAWDIPWFAAGDEDYNGPDDVDEIELEINESMHEQAERFLSDFDFEAD